MHSKDASKKATIWRIVILVVSLATIGSLACLADQLQWNALSVCEEAAQTIGRQSLLISYCSQANEDYVELWLVRDLKVVITPVANLFEVLVLAKCLYRSQRAFSSEEFPVSAGQWGFNEVHDSGWFIERIDLAYVYTHRGDSSFQCLGKVLQLECLVGVERISLPGDMMEKMMLRRSSSHRISHQSFDLLPARPREDSKIGGYIPYFQDL
ncbi:hypothetical protein ACFLS5_00630 [Candidatus Bipolaricaulota bacterium]